MAIFRPNPALQRQLRADPRYRATVRGYAEAIKSAAEQATPVNTGAAQRRYVVTEEDGETRVGNTDPFFHLIEWGSAKNPAYAPLRRGVRAAGLKLDEHPK